MPWEGRARERLERLLSCPVVSAHADGSARRAARHHCAGRAADRRRRPAAAPGVDRAGHWAGLPERPHHQRLPQRAPHRPGPPLRGARPARTLFRPGRQDRPAQPARPPPALPGAGLHGLRPRHRRPAVQALALRHHPHGGRACGPASTTTRCRPAPSTWAANTTTTTACSARWRSTTATSTIT